MAIKFSNQTHVEEPKDDVTLVNGQPIGSKLKKKKKFNVNALMLSLAIIPTVIMGFFALVPITTFFAGVLVATFLIVVILIPLCATIGLILFSEDYRAFIDKTSETLEKVFDNSFTNTMTAIAQEAFVYVLSIGAFMLIGSLIYFIFKKKSDPTNSAITGFLVGSIICIIIFIIASIFVGSFSVTVVY